MISSPAVPDTVPSGPGMPIAIRARKSGRAPGATPSRVRVSPLGKVRTALPLPSLLTTTSSTLTGRPPASTRPLTFSWSRPENVPSPLATGAVKLLIRSAPPPLVMTMVSVSVSAPRLIVSLPALPVTVSAPIPRSITSAPDPPATTSLPAPVEMLIGPDAADPLIVSA